jgi:hypothetical protein
MIAAAISRQPDSWSMSFEFEQIEIEEDGIQFGCFSGIAELGINDPRDRDFYVKCLAIEGVKRERQTLNGYSLSIMKTRDAVLLIRRPAGDDRTFRAHLFRKLETAIYASEDAQERFASELECV